jgi:hypothetical protein
MGLFENPILTWEEPGEFEQCHNRRPLWLRACIPVGFATIVLIIAATKIESLLPYVRIGSEFSFALLVIGLIGVFGPLAIIQLARNKKIPVFPPKQVEVFKDHISRECGKGNQFTDFKDISSFWVRRLSLKSREVSVVCLKLNSNEQPKWWHSHIHELTIEDPKILARIADIFVEKGIREDKS